MYCLGIIEARSLSEEGFDSLISAVSNLKVKQGNPHIEFLLLFADTYSP